MRALLVAALLVILYSGIGNIGGEEKWKARYLVVRASYYCPCVECCGKNSLGITATGRNAYTTKGVAVDPSVIPLKSRVDVPGYGNWIQADDTGGAIKGNKIDIRLQSHISAKRRGFDWLRIRVWTKE